MLLLPALITLREARDVQTMLNQALQREAGAGVVVDAVNLKNFDSAALAVLLGCRRIAQSLDKDLTVRNVPPKLASLAKLYGVDVLLLKAESTPA